MSEPHDRMLEDDTEDGAKVRRLVAAELSKGQRNDYGYVWNFTARPNQLPPPGDWRIWIIMAGRGFGKTRSGAEWVRMIADGNPDARIALVSSSLAEARAVMVEGESGLLAICRPEHRPIFEPSLRRIRFESGAQAQLFSAADPESLRGPQHSHACGPGAKGVLHQRGAEYPRRFAAARGDGFAIRTAR
ncbi:MAG: terminase large subunit domain-containing protein [Erythrobacter sp.]